MLSTYLIKPEGSHHSGGIYNLIHGHHLRITGRKEILITEAIVNELYSHLSQDLQVCAHLHLTGQICEVGLVEGFAPIERLLQITGKDPFPYMCDLRTVRRSFGSMVPFKQGKTIYYQNAIHRPQNKLEAERDLELFEFK